MAEKGIVSVNGFEMAYCKFGSGEKTFVIIPGISVQSVVAMGEAVEGAYAVMKDEFTTYVFDRRKEVPSSYSIFDMADDTVKAMKELGLGKACIFGASQGGMIAMTIAIRYPELVEKLILGSTSAHVKQEQLTVIDKWIELAKRKEKRELMQSFAKEIYPSKVYEENKAFFDDMSKTVTDKELEKFIILAKAIHGFDISGELDKIQCPTLVLGDFEDAVLDSDASMEIAEKVEKVFGFKLYMYIGYGHAAFDTAPDYQKRIHDFCMK